MLLIVAALPAVNSIDRYFEKKSNNEFISDEIIMDEDCGCSDSITTGYMLGIMKERSIPIHPDETLEKPTVIDDLPEYFNWMDFEGQDWTTPAKDQSSCGSCWIFTALGVLDSIINIRENRADLDVDLSEQYALSCLTRAGNCIAGWVYNAFFYIMCNRTTGNNCNGIIPESCFPYKAVDADGVNDYGDDNDPVLCDEKSEDWENYLIPISGFGKWYSDGSPEDIEAIKTQIMQDGPIGADMMITLYIHGKDNFLDWGWVHNEMDDYYSSSEHFDSTNHCVVVVGWKDDPLIDKGGYWICKNSWGPEWGYNGFFNIEYGSLRIDSSQIAWVNYDPDVLINWEPVANAGGIYYGDIGEEISFDGSGSFDHEGEIISYEWDFGDGYNEYGITAVHMYESPQVYPVKLTVRDNEGNTVNDTTWAFIGRSNEPPNKPSVFGPLNGKKGTKYDYTFSAVDPDGDDVYFYIYWGDMYVPVWIGPFSSGEEIILNHSWNDKLSHTLRVKAKDCYGFKSDWATLEVKMPKYNFLNLNLNLLIWIFERFPNAFPILKYLLAQSLGQDDVK